MPTDTSTVDSRANASGPSRHGPKVLEPGDGRLANGEPDLSPAAGYVAATPYQYSDESDALFAARVAMWESAKASAIETALGGPTFEARKKALKLKYEADLAVLEAEEDKAEGK